MKYIAHLSSDQQREQSVLSHSEGTAQLASELAKAFHAEDLGYRIGLLHDIGKFSLAFQRRIRGSKERVDHSTAGALLSYEQRDLLSAFCVAGHHGGLPDGGNPKMDTPDNSTLAGRMKRKPGKELEDFSAYATEVHIPLHVPSAEVSRFGTDIGSVSFLIRMLYSCLVDADWLDTEAFMTGQPRAALGQPLDELLALLEKRIASWWNPEEAINQKRCEILRKALDDGAAEPGLFSLTVPTGGGKTVASMAFALRHATAHAKTHGLRRIIYVIPYVSILEQTQKVFEDIFGAENVVAHYANVEYATDENGNVTDKRHLATENWDAPIILTTAVQFFESLFANRSSPCRKLHNIAGSVLIFDEAQMIPVPYLNPCLWGISQLIQHYGCSAVLCTATQPALNPRFQEYLPLHAVRELSPDVRGMDAFFRRVRYVREGKLSSEALAMHLNAANQVLCIVNTRKHAQDLFAMLPPEGSFHLSTAMYPAHRRAVLAEIRRQLDAELPCRVVSTSLVEAGVDVDFPTVWRALAGLDSIIQAAGRCNREGRRSAAESIVHVFEHETSAPQMLRQNISATEWVMRNHEDICSPAAIEAYFHFLYYRLKDATELDKHGILAKANDIEFPFATIAQNFHLIDTDDLTVYIPRDEGRALIEELQEKGPSRRLLRKLGQYGVGVYAAHWNNLLARGAIRLLSENTAVLLDEKLYDLKTGLSLQTLEGQGMFL